MRRAVGVMRVVVSLIAVAAVTAFYVLILPVNPTTIALSYLVIILFIASAWGIVEATTTSFVAVLCFNFFFLPPTGNFTIADPQNWIALVAFLMTSIVASQLSGRARQRELDAAERGRDLERLYALSRSMLLSPRGASLRGNIARHIADVFELPSVAVYDRAADAVAWAGPADSTAVESRLRDVAIRSSFERDADGRIVVAIQLGGAPIGSLALSDRGLSDTVLNSIVNLAAIGLERAKADEATARADAARASSELRAIVLDALAHDFKTPLTAMKGASSDLLDRVAADPSNHELVAIIDDGVDRLGALVTDAVQMIRIDAGRFAVHRERHRLLPIVAGVVNQFERRLDGHAFVQQVSPELNVDADKHLLELALRQLIDNAVKYSPSTAAITIAAHENGAVNIAVHNSDSAIPDVEQSRLFERFYRGTHAAHIPGTGMGLAIVQRIAEAHGGGVRVDSDRRTGTTFTLTLPRGAAA